jgi:predicted RNase H-related nuclease YkuK (DUF458 family)
MEIDYDVVRKAIEASDPKSIVYIGSDSKCFVKNKVRYVAYVGVIIIHHAGKHGGSLYRMTRTERDYGNLRQRLMAEVGIAIELATEIIDSVGPRQFQIHLDINPDPKHKSSICVKEATGYVLGTLGLNPKLKPEAFAASSASDKWAVIHASKKQRAATVNRMKKS